MPDDMERAYGRSQTIIQKCQGMSATLRSFADSIPETGATRRLADEARALAARCDREAEHQMAVWN